MTIYSGFTIYPLKMVIFHSYVSLPEGNWQVFLAVDHAGAMVIPCVKNSYRDGHGQVVSLQVTGPPVVMWTLVYKPWNNPH